MPNGSGDRQPLDPLGAPLGADGLARNTPNLLGVRLEKSEIQLAAKTVDQKILKRLLQLAGKEPSQQVTATDLHGADQTKFAQGVRSQLDGIVEELAQEVNTALSRTDQHYQIGRFGRNALTVCFEYSLLTLVL